ncbi:hypothetical protein C0Q70_03151 [Pomacea canaliculata]|uniref:Uncharacterized protein n=1 Tax=Pomacea canaliculata TaxID=400727 RepID=A0A2T7PRX7_POMCA|nr:hypothetical protein C0Q70_03151 [Pomacea canaliculata]
MTTIMNPLQFVDKFPCRYSTNYFSTNETGLTDWHDHHCHQRSADVARWPEDCPTSLKEAKGKQHSTSDC